MTLTYDTSIYETPHPPVTAISHFSIDDKSSSE